MDAKQKPVISGVIPCRNEASVIERTIGSLLEQVEPSGGFELIVADGMSDDGTRDILHRIASKDSRVKIVDNPRRITPAGMNVGIRAAKGKYIAILGAHNRYAKDYLARAVAFLDAHPEVDNVGGSMMLEPDNDVARAVAHVFHHPFSVGGARWHNPDYEGEADTVFGGIYRREVFDKIGYFDEELVRNQDDEFNLRLKRAGGIIWHTSQIKSYYRPRNSFRSLFLQYRQYGYWKVRVIQKHRLPASIRHLVPGLFVFSVIASVTCSLTSFATGYFLSSPVLISIGMFCSVLFVLAIASYSTLLLAGAFQLALKKDKPLFFKYFKAFACFHLGYGLGFLEGIRDFIILKSSDKSGQSTLTR